MLSIYFPGERYPWGDKFKPKRMNVWQGIFPMTDKKLDDWDTVSPVDWYPPQNAYGNQAMEMSHIFAFYIYCLHSKHLKVHWTAIFQKGE